jgi:hypothetical protein
VHAWNRLAPHGGPLDGAAQVAIGRASPLERQLYGLLTEALRGIAPKQPWLTAFDPIRCDMPKERQARGDDGAVLGPIPAVEAERLVEHVKGLISDGFVSAELCGDEVQHRLERLGAWPVDRRFKRILA